MGYFDFDEDERDSYNSNQNEDNHFDWNRQQEQDKDVRNNNQMPIRQKDSLGGWSILFGIIGILTSMLYFLGVPLSVVSIVLAVLARSRAGRFEGKGVAGLCLGIVGVCLSLLFFAMMLSMLQNPELVQAIQELSNSMGMPAGDL